MLEKKIRQFYLLILSLFDFITLVFFTIRLLPPLIIMQLFVVLYMPLKHLGLVLFLCEFKILGKFVVKKLIFLLTSFAFFIGDPNQSFHSAVILSISSSKALQKQDFKDFSFKVNLLLIDNHSHVRISSVLLTLRIQLICKWSVDCVTFHLLIHGFCCWFYVVFP